MGELTENVTDGLSYTVRCLESRGGASATLQRQFRGLGRTTGAFHLALGGDDGDGSFATEPVTMRDRENWMLSLAERATVLLTALQVDRMWLPPSIREEAAAFEEALERGEPRQPRVNEEEADSDFEKIRIHGDLHLGRTRKTRSGFALFHDESEPARLLHELRRKDAALKDVAAMLRSIEYASEVAARQRGDRFASGQDLRDAFLVGYLEKTWAQRVSFLPRSAQALKVWLDFFELERVLYEVGHELDHRPGWAWIPLRRAQRLLTG